MAISGRGYHSKNDCGSVDINWYIDTAATNHIMGEPCQVTMVRNKFTPQMAQAWVYVTFQFFKVNVWDTSILRIHRPWCLRDKLLVLL